VHATNCLLESELAILIDELKLVVWLRFIELFDEALDRAGH
jgi:hypothetical protein